MRMPAWRDPSPLSGWSHEPQRWQATQTANLQQPRPPAP
jgi:hypothetical protein